jgi:hypothetical protein
MLPWAFLLLALPVALLVIAETAPTACGELHGAFSDGVTTEQSETLGGFVASRCEVRNQEGVTDGLTVVNWSGLIAAISLCAGAWLAGASLTGRVRPRIGIVGVGVSAALIAGALTAYFA